jgi:hypothetical protein
MRAATVVGHFSLAGMRRSWEFSKKRHKQQLAPFAQEVGARLTLAMREQGKLVPPRA